MTTRTLAFLMLTFLIACKQTKKEPRKEPFNLGTLPSDWVQLTKTDSGFIVYKSCDMGNTLLTITNKQNKHGILLHGTQEDYDFDILETYQLNDSVIIKARWKDSKELQDWKFVWTDKAKQLGRWITTYNEDFTSNEVFVTATKQNNFRKVDQPCQECWGDDCDYIEKLKNVDAHPVDTIKRIFYEYIKNTEATDSPTDTEFMTRGLTMLQTVSDSAALELLINVWMYYDPTDFQTRELVNRILKQNKVESIKAIKKRKEHKRPGESEETAPYSELTHLISELEKL
jgi:hypothetical protein